MANGNDFKYCSLGEKRVYKSSMENIIGSGELPFLMCTNVYEILSGWQQKGSG